MSEYLTGLFEPREDDYPITVCGNLVEAPSLRFGASGTAFATTRLAVNGIGDNRDEVQFYDLVCFGDLAEHFASSTDKGNRVLVYGNLEEEEYQGEGYEEPISRLKIVASSVAVELRFATVEIAKIQRRTPSKPVTPTGKKPPVKKTAAAKAAPAKKAASRRDPDVQVEEEPF